MLAAPQFGLEDEVTIGLAQVLDLQPDCQKAQNSHFIASWRHRSQVIKVGLCLIFDHVQGKRLFHHSLIFKSEHYMPLPPIALPHLKEKCIPKMGISFYTNISKFRIIFYLKWKAAMVFEGGRRSPSLLRTGCK